MIHPFTTDSHYHSLATPPWPQKIMIRWHADMCCYIMWLLCWPNSYLAVMFWQLYIHWKQWWNRSSVQSGWMNESTGSCEVQLPMVGWYGVSEQLNGEVCWRCIRCLLTYHIYTKQACFRLKPLSQWEVSSGNLELTRCKSMVLWKWFVWD